MRERGLIIWSGGLDSTSLLFHLRSQEMLMSAVHFSYGSKHNSKEILAVANIAKAFKIPVRCISLDFIGKLFKSSLLQNGSPIPEGHYEDENMKQTVVPFRNGIMLSIAAGLAESENIPSVYIGAHAGDHTIYPDCRPNFLSSMGNAIKNGTWDNISLIAPFQNLSKGAIVTKGDIAGTPFDMTWTCYKGGPYHCGVCGACTERKEAFIYAGIEDPTFYKDVEDEQPRQIINLGCGIPGAEEFGQG